MGKLVFWAAVIALAYGAMKFLARSQRRGDAAQRGAAAGGKTSEAMLQCAHCGVHVPSSEALFSGTRAYCCSAHRDAEA
ncbi:MAG: hypothetical protein K0B16_12575 [Burkholderiaceae bacterium]|nr:hypothetical protein [Burkholderiaceae bacterium]